MTSDYLNGPGFNSEYKLVYSANEDAQPLGVFALCDVAPWDFAKAKKANISAQMVWILNSYSHCRLYHQCVFLIYGSLHMFNIMIFKLFKRIHNCLHCHSV